MTAEPLATVAQHLSAIYGSEADRAYERIAERIARFRLEHPAEPVVASERLSERDSILITYADQVRAPNEAPLRTLKRLLDTHLADTVSGVHLLPFFPWTSDDGFAVADYLAVDPDAGTWEDVRALAENHRLMFDAVVNHVSASHPWFEAFLRGDEPYVDYFITEDPDTDLSAVVRPRATPVLTAFDTERGTQHVWTTFGPDQIDLNYANPDVLVDVIDVLLEYVGHGAEILRLDAVTFLWKEVGTSCVHHPNTHRILKAMRSVMEAAAPWVVLLTETNVPHVENIGYFGDGADEAQMVYNFALPPLVLHGFHTEDATQLQAWARGLRSPSDETTFFNFLASHDGIGLRPVEQILPRQAVADMVERVRAHGGMVSMKRNSDGSESPYELNVSYFDALSDPESDEALERQIDRFITAQAIMLALAGVPGIYVHSLLGSRSARSEAERTGRARSINRAKFELAALERELQEPQSLRSRVLGRYRELLGARRSNPAFAPQSPQEVLDTPAGVFGIRRGAGVWCLHNVTNAAQRASLPADADGGRDLISGGTVTGTAIELGPAAFRWIELSRSDGAPS